MLKKTILLGCLMIMNHAQGAEFILDFFGAKELAYSLDLLEDTSSMTEKIKKDVTDTVSSTPFSSNEKIKEHAKGMTDTAKAVTTTIGVANILCRGLLMVISGSKARELYRNYIDEKYDIKNIIPRATQSETVEKTETKDNPLSYVQDFFMDKTIIGLFLGSLFLGYINYKFYNTYKVLQKLDLI